jgi:hypothetical protein
VFPVDTAYSVAGVLDPGPPRDTEISGLGADQLPVREGKGPSAPSLPAVSDEGRIPRAVTDAFNSA